jgi:hypothetical protein
VQRTEDWQKVKQLAERIRLVEDTVLEKGCEYNRLNMARIAKEMKREEEKMERASTAEDGDAEVVDRMVRPTAFVSDEEAAEGEGERRNRLNRVNRTRKGLTDSPFLGDPDANEMSTALRRIARGHIMAAEAEEGIGKGFLAVGHALHRAGL